MDSKYPNVVRALSETAWEILPEKLDAIAQIVAFRARGGELTPEEVQARVGSGPARKPAVVKGMVGVVPLYGVIFPRASLFTEFSGGTALTQWAADFQAMVSDPEVSGILIDCHSPGGSTYMVTETAAKVRAARGQKPIVAIANTLCCSAAYHIASQADEVVASPSSLVGSIGAYMLHEDWSKFDELVGVDATYVYAGKYKVDGNPREPLGDEARSHFQEIVDDVYGQFVADVAKGRGVRVAEVRSGYGQGRVVPASLAKELGLVDRVDTFENTIVRLASGKVAAGGARAEIEQLEASDDDERELVEASDDERELLASIEAWAADTRADMQTLPVRRALGAFANETTPTEATQ